MLAQRIGARVYFTVGSKKKKDFIMNTYHIAEECIFSSRETTFQRGIKLATNGRGVDVVLNSLADDVLRASWNCLAPFGRFVEIGRKDFIQNSRLEMENFLNLVTFSALYLPTISQQKPRATQENLLACHGFASGGRSQSDISYNNVFHC